MRNKLFALILLTMFTGALWAGDSAERFTDKIPDPRTSSSRIYDDVNLLDESAKKEINTLIAGYRKKTGRDIHIAVYGTIDRIDKSKLMDRLYYRIWQMGGKEGVLILHVLDRRSVWLYTEAGQGTREKLQWIEEDITRPFFKNRNFTNGYMDTVRAIGGLFQYPETERKEFIHFMKNKPDQQRDSLNETAAGYDARMIDINQNDIEIIIILGKVFAGLAGIFLFFMIKSWLLNSHLVDASQRLYSTYINAGMLFFPMGFIVLVMLLVLLKNTAYSFEDYDKVKSGPGSTFDLITSILSGLGVAIPLMAVAVLLIFVLPYQVRKKGVRYLWQIFPKKCLSCGSNMKMLEPNQAASYLQPAQIMERDLKARMYNVWQCSCGKTAVDSIEILQAEFLECPSCSNLTSIRTFPSPEHRGGQRINNKWGVEIGAYSIHECKFCNYEYKSTTMIADPFKSVIEEIKKDKV